MILKMRKKVSLKIKGMHCKSCAKNIEESLSELKGVEKASASFPDESATVQFDSEKTSIEKIGGEIKRLGYEPSSSPSTLHKGKGNGKTTLWQGIMYGLVPHIGCIGFIGASILGATVAVEFFKPLLLNP
ncbi:MAG: heavy-metal-associated domain-containing protein, partial [Candidatus Diapherotrites archaeon]|nr:heavy-metal-associated domain-containing protein [Candidatus Diapherotrites archaeon]